MVDIVVPQNTIDSARPADLSFAGEHQGLVNTASRALELRRATEALRSQEALTKAYKDATDPKTGAINFATVKEELKNNPDYTLGAGEDTAGIGQNAERQKSTADEFNRSNAELEALYNRGGITYPQLQKAIAFNKQGENLAGVNNAGQYGSGAYLQTILATKPEVTSFNRGDQISVAKINPLSGTSTPLTITNTLSTGIDPNRRAEIESTPRTIPYTDPKTGATITQTVQPIVTNRRGYTSLNAGPKWNIDSNTVSQDKAFQEAVQQAPKTIQDENTHLTNLNKIAISAYNNQGKPNYTPEGQLFAEMGINYTPTMDRATLHKLVASYNANNIAPSVDQQRQVADQLGNEKMPDMALIASSLVAAKHAANLLHSEYLLQHPNDLRKYQDVIAQYGPHGNELGMAYHLNNLLKSNPHVAKRTIMLLNKAMPGYLNNISDAMKELHEMQKQGLFRQGIIQ